MLLSDPSPALAFIIRLNKYRMDNSSFLAVLHNGTTIYLAFLRVSPIIEHAPFALAFCSEWLFAAATSRGDVLIYYAAAAGLGVPSIAFLLSFPHPLRSIGGKTIVRRYRQNPSAPQIKIDRITGRRSPLKPSTHRLPPSLVNRPDYLSG